MKKTKIMTAAIAMCMAAAMFVGCSKGSSGDAGAAIRIEGGQTQISIDPDELSEPIEGYAFQHNGYDIGIGSKENYVFAVMGEPYDAKPTANCAGEGMGIDNFYYDGRVRIQIAEKTREVTEIEITEPVIDCGGVSVGDSAETITSVFGDADYQSDILIEYKKEGMTLHFELANGKVAIVKYLKNETVE